MTDIAIEQALYGNPDEGGFRFLGRSPGFRDDWLAEAERICTGFGNRPAGVACPACIFAQPFGDGHVAVVQVADLGADDAQRPGALGFRLLIVPRPVYEALAGDPFLIADRFPSAWQARGDLAVLAWGTELPSRRTVAQVQKVLQNGDSATLLGGVQALIDSGRLVFERPAPATDLLRRLWLLLPDSTRCHIWPASFAFANTLGFDVVVVPRADFEQFADYVREEQAGDYPEGRYELNLQIAAEAGDQAELDKLFARRSSAQTLRLGVILLVVMAVLVVVMNLFNRTVAPTGKPRPTTAMNPPASGTESAVGHPAPEADYPPVGEETQRHASAALCELLVALGQERPTEHATLGELLAALGERLAGPDMPRDPARAAVVERLDRGGKLDHPEARIRAWLWLYGKKEYDDRRRNLVELIEILGKTVAARPGAKGPPR
ncbi:hypothetical protein AYO44_05615 [Planctomycetaceae bacterium SCGC AG-212-F19]|nr:hypothetical protein AYO44_05615 [Planctomycetaceae bacterium SCGC AG-212-F19]